MESRPTDRRPTETATPEEASSNGESRAASGGVQGMLQARIQQYLTDSLQANSPVQALLGAMNSRAIEMNVWLEDAILDRMHCGRPTVEGIESLKAAMDLHLRCTREIERLAQFARKTAPQK